MKRTAERMSGGGMDKMIDEETKEKAIEEFRTLLKLRFKSHGSDFYVGYMIGERVMLMKLGVLTWQEVDAITNEVFWQVLKEKEAQK